MQSTDFQSMPLLSVYLNSRSMSHSDKTVNGQAYEKLNRI